MLHQSLYTHQGASAKRVGVCSGSQSERSGRSLVSFSACRSLSLSSRITTTNRPNLSLATAEVEARQDSLAHPCSASHQTSENRVRESSSRESETGARGRPAIEENLPYSRTHPPLLDTRGARRFRLDLSLRPGSSPRGESTALHSLGEKSRLPAILSHSLSVANTNCRLSERCRKSEGGRSWPGADTKGGKGNSGVAGQDRGSALSRWAGAYTILLSLLFFRLSLFPYLQRSLRSLLRLTFLSSHRSSLGLFIILLTSYSPSFIISLSHPSIERLSLRVSRSLLSLRSAPCSSPISSASPSFFSRSLRSLTPNLYRYPPSRSHAILQKQPRKSYTLSRPLSLTDQFTPHPSRTTSHPVHLLLFSSTSSAKYSSHHLLPLSPSGILSLRSALSSARRLIESRRISLSSLSVDLYDVRSSYSPPSRLARPLSIRLSDPAFSMPGLLSFSALLTPLSLSLSLLFSNRRGRPFYLSDSRPPVSAHSLRLVSPLPRLGISLSVRKPPFWLCSSVLMELASLSSVCGRQHPRTSLSLL
ncbi:hypothetical protein C7M84_013899 [Penaeus vannamei]|uniref:Uncharacterized protein n=1 Tax=Penaeus vannamei TaxID=6689 RepID=A0A423SUW2_PENVA|nr:hypothetical protein C7M84_013899 [Penaeus vannamei]